MGKLENGFRPKKASNQKKVEQAAKNREAKDDKLFFYKQLADVVESVCAAVNISTGLSGCQRYLFEIGVLKHSPEEYAKNLDGYVRKLESNANMYQHRYMNALMGKLEEKIGYSFKCKALLCEALTHTSYGKERDY